MAWYLIIFTSKKKNRYTVNVPSQIFVATLTPLKVINKNLYRIALNL